LKYGRFGDFRWLGIVRFSRVLLPHNHITLVRYFTADLHPLKGDAGTADRQRVYLRALRSLPDLVVHKGRFAARQIVRPLVTPAQPIDGLSSMVRVWNLEEKGSDVNLASYLLRDGFLGEYEAAVVISDDLRRFRSRRTYSHSAPRHRQASRHRPVASQERLRCRRRLPHPSSPLALPARSAPA